MSLTVPNIAIKFIHASDLLAFMLLLNKFVILNIIMIYPQAYGCSRDSVQGESKNNPFNFS